MRTTQARPVLTLTCSFLGKLSKISTIQLHQALLSRIWLLQGPVNVKTNFKDSDQTLLKLRRMPACVFSTCNNVSFSSRGPFSFIFTHPYLTNESYSQKQKKPYELWKIIAAMLFLCASPRKKGDWPFFLGYFSRWQIDICLLLFSENRLLHFIQNAKAHFLEKKIDNK